MTKKKELWWCLRLLQLVIILVSYKKNGGEKEEDLLPSSSSSTAKSTNNKPPKYIEKQVTNFWGVRDINSFGEYTVANDYETLASFEEREEDTYAFGEETGDSINRTEHWVELDEYD
ncbi:22036_t:CDS:2 [Entrophospora sp. SA101]|nr:22036_t:CDS:2 [Entrophospora sp. SA101]